MKTRGGKSPHFTDRSMTELMTVSRKTPVINIMCHISNMKQHDGHKQALDRFLQLWEKVWENTNGRGNETSADLCSKFPRVNTKQIVARIVATFYGALRLICELCCTQ